MIGTALITKIYESNIYGRKGILTSSIIDAQQLVIGYKTDYMVSYI